MARRTTTSVTSPGAASSSGGRHVPFVLHEVAEYIVAVALVAVGFHTSGAAEFLLIAVGTVMLVLGAVSSGKLGAFRWLSRRAHHVGDLVIVAVLALSPIPLWSRFHVAGTILAEVVALVLLRIERGTLYHDVPRPPRAASSPELSGATESAARLGATAGVVASTAVATATQLAPVAGRAARSGIRTLGVVAGATRRSARAQAAQRRSTGS